MGGASAEDMHGTMAEEPWPRVLACGAFAFSGLQAAAAIRREAPTPMALASLWCLGTFQ